MRVTAFLLGAVALIRKEDPAPAAPAADVHAVNAELSAHAAQKAAAVANQVTVHAQEMHENARVALHHARGALQDASKDTSGMTAAQHEALAKADKALANATAKVEQETLEQSKWVSQTLEAAAADQAAAKASTTLESQIADLEAKIAEANKNGIAQAEADKLSEQLDALKAKLAAQKAAEAKPAGAHESLGKMQDDLSKLEHQVETMEDIHDLQKKLDAAAGVGPSAGQADADADTAALRAELKELQDMVAKMSEGKDAASTTGPDELEAELAKLKQAIAEKIAQDEQRAKDAAAAKAAAQAAAEAAKHAHDHSSSGASSGSFKSPEVDTEMPYGELEPFGREDTATELTENSIAESDRMVDQIERAEVAEEKRAVFRALTRLRGAAITSYDGIARAQTGNIDEYNHNHQWRSSHPLHHLADEESDVAKWAFPNNAD